MELNEISHKKPETLIFFSILFGLVFAIGIINNIIVVLVYTLKPSIKKQTHYFFTNLSISDMLLLTVCLPLFTSTQFDLIQWEHKSTYCKLHYFIEHCLTLVSSLTIISIGVERCCAVTSPLKVKLFFTSKRSKLILVLIWILGVLSSTPFVFMAQVEEKECNLSVTKGNLIYMIGFNAILVFLPAVCLSVLYAMIIYRLKRRDLLFGKKINYFKKMSINMSDFLIKDSASARNSREESMFGHNLRRPKKSSNVTIIISIVTVVIFCLQLPARLLICVSFAYDFKLNKSSNSFNRPHNAFVCMVMVVYFMRCLCNPFIYNFLSSKFRKSLKNFSLSRKSSYSYAHHSYVYSNRINTRI